MDKIFDTKIYEMGSGMIPTVHDRFQKFGMNT